MSIVQIVLVLIVAGVAGVESVLENTQFERPLFVCTMIGIILGDMQTGIILGGTLELIALGWLNIGAALPPDVALAGVISAIMVIMGKQSVSAGIAIAVPVAVAGVMLNMLIRTVSVYFMHLADKFAEKGNTRGIDICQVIPMILHALRIMIPAALVCTFINTNAVQSALASIPAFITDGLTTASGFIVVVGYAMVIKMMKSKYLMTFFFIGFVLSAFTKLNLIAFGIIGVCLAIIYIQLNPKYSASSQDDLEMI